MLAIDHIIKLLLKHKYGFLFPVAVVEGPIISLISGFLVAKGILNIFAVYWLLVAGDIVGDTVYYALGRFGGRLFIKKWGQIFRITDDKLVRAEKHFHEHFKKTLFLGKSSALGSVILIAAGLAKMPYAKFILVNFLASVVKTLILVALGYYFGQALDLVDKYLGYFGAVMGIATLVILYVLVKKTLKKSYEKTDHSH